MFPTVFRIPFIERDIPGYGLMLMIAFLVSIAWAARRAARSGANPEIILNCGFVALLAGVLGCRIMYVIHYWDQFSNRGGFLQTLWAIIDVSKGGLEFYGGFILATVSVPIWLRLVEKVSLRWYMDIIAPSAALGLAIGRIGCLANGCCHGSTCELPWAITFPYGSPASVEQWKHRVPGADLPKELINNVTSQVMHPISRESIAATDAELQSADKLLAQLSPLRDRYESAKDPAERSKIEAEIRKALKSADRERGGLKCAADPGARSDIVSTMSKYHVHAAQIRDLAARHRSLPVHPTQIYSTITAGLIALLLNALYWRRSRDGQVILLLLTIEPVSRYVLEILRADNPVDSLGTFTISQALAIGLMILGGGGLLILQKLAPRSKIAKVWVPEEEPAKA